MEHSMLELREQGCPLSALYPATQTLYRAVGFEQAGAQFEITVPLSAIDARERELTLRPIVEADHDTVTALYRTEAMRHNGMLDRTRFSWGRVREPRGKKASGYIVERDGSAEGYVYIIQDDIAGLGYDLRVTDFVALTPEAGLRLFTFLADHRSVGRNAMLFRAPNDPLLALPAEQVYGIKLLFHWFLRIVDVSAALEARGYNEGVAAEIHLRVHDDLITSNRGDFVLRVENGRGRVTPGGEGRLNLDIRGLAMMYSGHRSPIQILSTGLLRATEDDARAAAAAFAGTDPWMTDRF
jgi:predicted acetyltransferase